MSQTVPAAVQLGFAYAGAAGIGYRVLRLDGATVVVAPTTAGVVNAPAGSDSFYVTGGHQAHDEGGYRYWQQNGVDITGAFTIEPAAPTVSGDGKIEFTYTLTNDQTFQPIPGATIRITSDIAGLITIWTGTTDVLGIARNACGDKPRLPPGTIYLWRALNGFTFNDPDIESVS